MTPGEFRELLALIWGQHGAQAKAARHFRVAERSVRRWAHGERRIPEDVAAELRRLARRAPLPTIPPPPDGSTCEGAEGAECTAAVRPAYRALIAAAQAAGWEFPEIVEALASLAIDDARRPAE